jgi:predicted phosphodiesterase
VSRILVISDIHGNLEALEAVLLDAGTVDQSWCLGDIAGYGPQPNECIARVKGLPELTCMMGNHDFAAITDVSLDTFNTDARKALIRQREMLTEESKTFLGERMNEPVERGEVTLVHGSPHESIWEYILNPTIARQNLDYFWTRWCMVGHTHYQAIFQFHSEDETITIEIPPLNAPYKMVERAILNPGSVGQPRDHDPRAAYAIYNDEEKTWEPRRVAYDIRKVQKLIHKNGLPPKHADRLADGW